MGDKIALITGGSGGIGRAIAIKLSENGFNIAISYLSNEKAAMEVIEEIEKNNVKGLAIKADVSKEEDVEKIMETVKKEMGNIDVLVNNAGITRDNILLRMKTEDWDEVINTNLSPAKNCQ